jgi:hypothetical protein
MASPIWRSTLIDNAWFPDAPLDFQEKSLDLFPGGFRGDVDLLLVPNEQPGFSVAIQIKRVKVRGTRLNKLHEFEAGIEQANLLAQVGFSQVYLFIFVVVDTREQNGGKLSYSGPDTEVRSKVEQAIAYSNKFDPRVGLIHYQFVQPMDHPPLGVGTYGVHLVRRAELVAQPAELTNAIVKLIKSASR